MVAGDIIKKARLKMNLSQEQLGEMLGVTKVSVCGYETGTRTPTLEIFQKLIRVLNLSADQLLNMNTNIVSDNEESYGFKVTEEELEIIKQIRKNPDLYKKVVELVKNNM